MALQLDYHHQQLGVIIYNAYWRINPKSGLVGGKDGMNYVIELFKDANSAHVDNAQPIERHTFMFTPNISSGADNFIAQAYTHAKTLPYFSECVDA